MTPPQVKVVLPLDDLRLIEDALCYYRASTQVGGPDDHEVADIRRIEKRVGRIITYHENRETAS